MRAGRPGTSCTQHVVALLAQHRGLTGDRIDPEEPHGSLVAGLHHGVRAMISQPAPGTYSKASRSQRTWVRVPSRPAIHSVTSALAWPAAA